MTTPTASEWLLSLRERPDQYADLLAVHDGSLAVAAWVLAHVRLQAACHPGPPCPGDLLGAALTIAEHAGRFVSVPSKDALARDAAGAGYPVSGL